MQFHIETMTCGGCVRGGRAIQSVDPAAEIQADPALRKVEVRTSAAREALVAALAQAGFEPA